MNTPLAYYPPSPKNVPEALVETGPSFRRNLNLVIASLILFFFTYFSLLLVGFALLIAVVRHPLPILFKIVAAFFLLAIELLLIKNLFRRRSPIKGSELRIEHDEHPRFFRFLERVCDETGAPVPNEVFVSPDVNGAAGVDVSVLGLFVAPRLRLVLGLGLVSAINLTEFKALLAHEFGHLSQFRQKSGPFVRLAMNVVANVIGGRDRVDRFIETGYAGPLKWAFAPFFWGCRGTRIVLEWAFSPLGRLNASLSREMEFHADLVAVSVAGSDAISSLLYKSHWGQECFEQALLDLSAARDHDLYSCDVFHHQRRAGKHLRRIQEDPFRGTLPALPHESSSTVQLFREDDNQAGMWDDHPTNYDREENAKTCYIRTEYDERSPWILFDEPEELRERVTRRVYRDLFDVKKKLPLRDAAEVQKFIDVEQEEAILDAKYGGYFDQRFLAIFNLRDCICDAADSRNSLADLVGNHAALFSDAVRRFSRQMNRHFEEEWVLRGLSRGFLRLKRKRLEFRGESYPKKAARRLLRQVEGELEADIRWSEEFDRKSFITYHELASLLDPAWAEELEERYRFHFVLIKMWKKLRSEEGYVQQVTEMLVSSGGDLAAEEFYVVLSVLSEAHATLRNVIRDSESFEFPALTNLPAGESVRDFLLREKLVPSLRRSWRSGDWIKKFLSQFHQVNRKLRRVHGKSLASILKLRETIGEAGVEKWRTQQAEASAPNKS